MDVTIPADIQTTLDELDEFIERITEGSEEIQMRKVGQHLFGFGRRS